MTESGEPQAGPANRSDQPARRLLLLLLGGVAGSAIGVAVALFGGSGRSAGTNITIGVAVGLVATIAITVLLQRQVGGFMALSGMARLREATRFVLDGTAVDDPELAPAVIAVARQVRAISEPTRGRRVLRGAGWVTPGVLALGVLYIGEAEGLVALAILAGMVGLSELGWRSELRRARRAAAAEQHARELLDQWR